MQIILYVILAIGFGAAAAWLALRNQPRAGANDDLRSEMALLRETTDRSLRDVSNIFGTQLQSVGDNVQKALGGVTADVNSKLQFVQQQMMEQLGQNVSMMSSTSATMNERMASVQGTFAGLQKQVGEMTEQARQLGEMSKSMAALERVLQAPKLRGGFGEAQLENLLGAVFPKEQYQMYCAFSSGEIADAVVTFPQGRVVIDSKFPLENFRKMATVTTELDKRAARRDFLKDVKRRVDEVATRYIKPSEGTLPFALMYIPAENVYYETIIRDEDGNDLYAYCQQRHVFPVSPNSLYAYLQTIVVGLNSMRISQRAEAVLREIESLKVELHKFEEAYDKVGSHLRNAVARFDDSSKGLEKVEVHMRALTTGGEDQIELFDAEKKREALAAGSQS